MSTSGTPPTCAHPSVSSKGAEGPESRTCAQHLWMCWYSHHYRKCRNKRHLYNDWNLIYWPRYFKIRFTWPFNKNTFLLLKHNTKTWVNKLGLLEVGKKKVGRDIWNLPFFQLPPPFFFSSFSSSFNPEPSRQLNSSRCKAYRSTWGTEVQFNGKSPGLRTRSPWL